MSSNGVSDEKRTDSEQSTDSNTRGPTWYDLTAFQQTILRVLAEMDADDTDRMYGMEIKRRLEDRYETDINHGRLYPNLDDLNEMGLIEVGKLDKRTNSYELTDDGRRMLERQREEWEDLSLPAVAMADGGHVEEFTVPDHFVLTLPSDTFESLEVRPDGALRIQQTADQREEFLEFVSEETSNVGESE